MIMMDYNNKMEDQETLLNLIKEEADLKEGDEGITKFESFYKFLGIEPTTLVAETSTTTFDDLKKEYLRAKSLITPTPEKPNITEKDEDKMEIESIEGKSESLQTQFIAEVNDYWDYFRAAYSQTL